VKILKQIGLDIVKAWAEIVMLSLILCSITAAFTPAPDCYLWVAMFAVYSVIGVLLGTALPGLQALRLGLSILIAIGGTVLEFLFLLEARTPIACIFGVFALLAMLRGSILAENEWDEVTPPAVYTLIVFLSLIFTLAVNMVPVLEEFRPITTFLGPIIVIVGLLTMNTLNMEDLTAVQRSKTTTGSMSVSKNLRAQNRALLLLVLAIVLALSGLAPLWHLLSGLIKQFLAWLTRTRYEAPPPKGDFEQILESENSIKFQYEIPEVDNTRWYPFMTTIVWVIVICAICFLLFMAFKGLRLLVRFLKNMNWLNLRDEIFTDEYEDDRESLVDLKDLPKQYLQRMTDWVSEHLKREPAWDELTSYAEKARVLYRRTLVKARAGGFSENAAHTPSQTLREVAPHVKTSQQSLDSLRDCYEEARYGEREPDGQTVEALNKEI